MSDVVEPRTVILPLMRGRTITVWDELNHGQYIAMLARMYRESASGELQRDVFKTTDAVMLAYLVDWTLTDSRGERLEIQGLKPDELQDVLNNLRQSTALEIKRAIDAHHARLEAAAAEQKKTESSDTPSSPTSQYAGSPA